MTRKQVVPRAAANRDIEGIIDFYLAEGGGQTVQQFVAALEKAVDRIGRHPSAGSPRYALELRIPGLRCCTLQPFPHLLFCVEQETRVEIWRVLHGHRDIPQWPGLLAPRDRDQ